MQRDVILIVVSAALAAVISFAVAHYTVEANNNTQRDAIARENRSAVYLPLVKNLSEVITCVSTDVCSKSELLRANRAANAAIVASAGEASVPVINLTDKVATTLAPLVNLRLSGKLTPSSKASIRILILFGVLQRQIARELE